MADEQRENNRRAEDRVLIADFQELADTVLGSRMSDLEGGGRNHDGLVHDMRSMRTIQLKVQSDVVATKEDVAKLVNGGSVRLSMAQKVGAGVVFAFLVWREVEPFIGG